MEEKLSSLETENMIKGYALNVIFYFITFVPLVLFNGWCLSLLYGWWLLSITDMPLTVIQCTGIYMVFSFLRSNIDVKKKKDKDEYGYWAKIFALVVGKLCIVGINYLVWLVLI